VTKWSGAADVLRYGADLEACDLFAEFVEIVYVMHPKGPLKKAPGEHRPLWRLPPLDSLELSVGRQRARTDSDVVNPIL